MSVTGPKEPASSAYPSSNSDQAATIDLRSVTEYGLTRRSDRFRARSDELLSRQKLRRVQEVPAAHGTVEPLNRVDARFEFEVVRKSKIALDAALAADERLSSFHRIRSAGSQRQGSIPQCLFRRTSAAVYPSGDSAISRRRRVSASSERIPRIRPFATTGID